MRGLTSMLMIGAGVILLGCAHGPSRNVPFSDDWTHMERREWEINERKERLRGRQPTAEEGGARPNLILDDRGRPKLNVGGLQGFSADLSASDGGSAELKYRGGWDAAKPQRRGTRRE